MENYSEVAPGRWTGCFGCGIDNPHGLQLKFKWDGKSARAEFIPLKAHQGWPGFVHGGLLATMLDEAAGWSALGKGIDMVTARMEILYRNPARIGIPLIITGTITRENSKRFEAYSTINTKNGTLIAECNSVYIIRPGGLNDARK